MLEFFKERKILILIILLAVGLIAFKTYSSMQDFEKIENNELIAEDNSQEEGPKSDDEIIVVHITGEVKKTGVVRIKEGSRIEDVIEAAGGLTERADISNVNLAYLVEDGMKIKIPALEDDELSKQNYVLEGAGENIIISDEVYNRPKNTIVNINTANASEFETLPGIGPSLASKIVEYREENGKFKNAEDIKNVTGIGDSKFEKIKDYIKVK